MATFEDRCGDFRRSMYRLSKIDDGCHDVSTFEDRCVDLRRSMYRPSEIDVLTFEDRSSMCRPSKIDGQCEIRLLYLLKTLILYISCMRITPRVCTSVLSLSYVCVYVCVTTHNCRLTHWNHKTEIPTCSQQYSDRFKFCRFSLKCFVQKLWRNMLTSSSSGVLELFSPRNKLLC